MKTLQIRLEDADLKDAHTVLKDLGLTLPGAVRLFLRKVVLEQKIPFSIELSGPRRKEPPVPPLEEKKADTTMGTVAMVAPAQSIEPLKEAEPIIMKEVPIEVEIGYGFGKPAGVKTRVPWKAKAPASAKSPDAV